MIKVSVFCASGNHCDMIYLKSAYKLGQLLAKENAEIFYGGGKIGLMGELANGALSNNGSVTGVIPKMFYERGLGNDDIQKMIITEDMDERKKILITAPDFILVLPGGIGTLEELIQALSMKFLKMIDTPIIIINFNNYFAPQLEMLHRFYQEKFMNEDFVSLFSVVTSPEEAILLMRAQNPYLTSPKNRSDFA